MLYYYISIILTIYAISRVETFRNNACAVSFNESIYNDLSTIETHLACVKETLPASQVRLGSVGHSSYNGKTIWKLTMSKDFSANKSIIWIDCGMQAKDWLTHSSCIYIIDSIATYLLKGNSKHSELHLRSDLRLNSLPVPRSKERESVSGSKARSRFDNILINNLIDNYDILIIPVVNPDGYEYSWTKNNRNNMPHRDWRKNTFNNSNCPLGKGVFISQNFNYNFGEDVVNTNCKHEMFIGDHANSEFETQALSNLLNDEMSLHGIFAIFHMEDVGSRWMYPWVFTEDKTGNEQCLDMVCEAGVKAANRNMDPMSEKYRCISANEFAGSRSGTFIDYAYYTHDIIPVFSLALREDTSDTNSDIITIAEEIFEGILTAVDKLSDPLCKDAKLDANKDTGLCGRTDKYNPKKYNQFDRIESHLQCINSLLPHPTLKYRGKSEGSTHKDKRDILQMVFTSYSVKPKGIVWLDCGMQARDWITISTCMYIIDSISNHLQGIKFDIGIQKLLDDFDVYIIPVVNPNGYVRSWAQYYRYWIKNTQVEKNNICDGVFISQNFDSNFDSPFSDDEQCNEEYVGKHANSTKESEALSGLLKNLDKDNRLHVFHLEFIGNTWKYPYYYNNTADTYNSECLDTLCEIAVKAIHNINKKKVYTCGQAAKVEKERGGTFIDFVFDKLKNADIVYSVAPSSSVEVEPKYISTTGEEILRGILAIMEPNDNLCVSKGTTTVRALPATEGPAND